MKTTKSTRRPGGASGGGIRKRGPTRTDRDGDMDMDGSARGGKRGGRDSGRPRGSGGGRSAGGGRLPPRDRTLNAIQAAISDTSKGPAQANIRQGKGAKGNSTQISIIGWRNSNASSKRDGGVENLISFLERKLNTAPKGSRFKITKVSPNGIAQTRISALFLLVRLFPGYFPKDSNSLPASRRSTTMKHLNRPDLSLCVSPLIFASLHCHCHIILRFSDLQLVAS